MACFLVPATEAIVTTIVTKVAKSKMQEPVALKNGSSNKATDADADFKIPFSRKLKWLSNLLWGGSLLLAFEHMWHGEIQPWFPFLTAASNPQDATVMLHEMSTIGVSMAVLVTAIWVVMVLVSSAMEKKALKAQSAIN